MSQFLHKIYGHENIKKLLKSFFDKNRIPHALLFSGPCGVGKRFLVREWTKILLCGAVEDSSYCGVCPSCKIFDSKNHPDYLSIQLLPEKKNISIDQIRELIKFSQFFPILSKRKILIIDGADKLTIPAQNAFLKTLEELPQNQLVILITLNKESLLPTVLSRVIDLNFQNLDDGVIKKILKEKGISEKECDVLLSALSGSLRNLEYYNNLNEKEYNFFENFYKFIKQSVVKPGNRSLSGQSGNVTKETFWDLSKETDREYHINLTDFVMGKSHRDLSSDNMVRDKENRLALVKLYEKSLLYRKSLEANGNISLGFLNWISQV